VHAHELNKSASLKGKKSRQRPSIEIYSSFFFLEDNIAPMLCIGESKDEYTAGLNTAVCATQLSKDLRHEKKKTYDQTNLSELSHCTTQHWLCNCVDFFSKQKHKQVKKK
jgi:hypothetical protein